MCCGEQTILWSGFMFHVGAWQNYITSNYWTVSFVIAMLSKVSIQEAKRAVCSGCFLFASPDLHFSLLNLDLSLGSLTTWVVSLAFWIPVDPSRRGTWDCKIDSSDFSLHEHPRSTTSQPLHLLLPLPWLFFYRVSSRHIPHFLQVLT